MFSHGGVQARFCFRPSSFSFRSGTLAGRAFEFVRVVGGCESMGDRIEYGNSVCGWDTRMDTVYWQEEAVQVQGIAVCMVQWVGSQTLLVSPEGAE